MSTPPPLLDGEVRGLRNPILLLTTPLPGLGAQLELHHPLSWPSLSPGGPKLERGAAAASAPPPWAGRGGHTPCPFQAPFYKCHGNSHKMGQPWLCMAAGYQCPAQHVACFSCYHPSGNSRGRAWLPPGQRGLGDWLAVTSAGFIAWGPVLRLLLPTVSTSAVQGPGGWCAFLMASKEPSKAQSLHPMICLLLETDYRPDP